MHLSSGANAMQSQERYRILVVADGKIVGVRRPATTAVSNGRLTYYRCSTAITRCHDSSLTRPRAAAFVPFAGSANTSEEWMR
jgi:hypothetical protein